MIKSRLKMDPYHPEIHTLLVSLYLDDKLPAESLLHSMHRFPEIWGCAGKIRKRRGCNLCQPK